MNTKHRLFSFSIGVLPRFSPFFSFLLLSFLLGCIFLSVLDLSELLTISSADGKRWIHLIPLYYPTEENYFRESSLVLRLVLSMKKRGN